MPIYEYVCPACEGRFERLLTMGASDPACPSCGEERLRRQPSRIALVAAGGRPSGSSSGGGCACGGACACGRWAAEAPSSSVAIDRIPW